MITGFLSNKFGHIVSIILSRDMLLPVSLLKVERIWHHRAAAESLLLVLLALE
jgi:hypothetical protein